jgi:hypothetical protein
LGTAVAFLIAAIIGYAELFLVLDPDFADYWRHWRVVVLTLANGAIAAVVYGGGTAGLGASGSWLAAVIKAAGVGYSVATIQRSEIGGVSSRATAERTAWSGLRTVKGPGGLYRAVRDRFLTDLQERRSEFYDRVVGEIRDRTDLAPSDLEQELKTALRDLPVKNTALEKAMDGARQLPHDTDELLAAQREAYAWILRDGVRDLYWSRRRLLKFRSGSGSRSGRGT